MCRRILTCTWRRLCGIYGREKEHISSCNHNLHDLLNSLKHSGVFKPWYPYVLNRNIGQIYLTEGKKNRGSCKLHTNVCILMKRAFLREWHVSPWVILFFKVGWWFLSIPADFFCAQKELGSDTPNGSEGGISNSRQGSHTLQTLIYQFVGTANSTN